MTGAEARTPGPELGDFAAAVRVPGSEFRDGSDELRARAAEMFKGAQDSATRTWVGTGEAFAASGGLSVAEGMRPRTDDSRIVITAQRLR